MDDQRMRQGAAVGRDEVNETTDQDEANETEGTKPVRGGGIGAFLVLFLVPATFTYLSGILLVGAVFGEGASAEEAGSARVSYLAICYAVMAFACWLRGRATDRKWLIAFPILGGVFDMFLGFVPFVPSVLNLVVLILGLQSKKE